MVRPTDVLHMYHEEDDDDICELNQINRDNKVRNNACWKCGEVAHFAWECPLNNVIDGKLQDKYAWQIQHTYTGSTPVTENMWHDLIKRAISATANNMVLASKYKQMKNKVQLAQATSSSVTMTTSSTPKTTQKQYTTTPKTTVTTSPQTLVMKPVGTSATQSSNKNQNWRGSGNKTTTMGTGTSTSTSVTTSGKNGKYTGPTTRSRTRNALNQLLETIPENLLTDSETECEDNVLTDNNNNETDVEEDFIHVTF